MRSRIICHLLGMCALAGMHALSVDADVHMRSAAETVGLGDGGEANGAAFGDLNADGWPDLFVARLGRDEPSLLYRNEAGHFTLDQDRWVPPGRAMGGSSAMSMVMATRTFTSSSIRAPINCT